MSSKNVRLIKTSAQTDARECEELSRFLFESSSDGIGILSVDGKFLDINPAAMKVMGVPDLASISGRDYLSFWAGEQRAKAEQAIAEARDGRTAEFEAYYAGAETQQPFWWRIRISPIHDEVGTIVKLAVVGRDVTSKMPAEATNPEERFKLMIDSVKDYAIFMLDPQGHVVTWNAGAKRFKGWQAFEIIGKHFSTFYPTEDRDWKPAMELKEAARIGRFEDEGWRVRKDGSRFWANVVITAIRDHTGRLVGFGKVTRDLTERKRVEDELRESNAFLDSVVANIPNMIFVKDAKDLKFVRFNRAGEELLGFTSQELIGKNDYDFFPKEEADHFTSRDREVLRNRQVMELEEKILTKNRGIRILKTKKLPIYDSKGNPEYLLGISEDITEFKKAQERLLEVTRDQAAMQERQVEAQRATFLAQISTMLSSSLDHRATLGKLANLLVPLLADWCTVTIMRPDGGKERVAGVHRTTEKTRLIGEFIKFYPPTVQEDHTDVGQVFKTGKPFFQPVVNDSMLCASAQDQRHLQLVRELGCTSCIIVPMVSGKKILGAISLIMSESHRSFRERDLALAEEIGRRAGIAIDNAFLYEQSQKAIRTRDDFMSIASHELKTPITSLKLQIQIRRRNLEKGNWANFSIDKFPKLIADDEKQVNRLTRLVDDMLDISRISTGKFHMSPEPVDLRTLVDEVLERFTPQLQASGISVTRDLGVPVQGEWDRYRLEQVVTNLLTNAMKYGGGKPIHVSLTAKEGTAELRVRDEGIGVAEIDQGRIFQQFERAISANTVSGLGLGLFIVRQIVEAHGGTVSVESKLGKGSTFIVRLPIGRKS